MTRHSRHRTKVPAAAIRAAALTVLGLIALRHLFGADVAIVAAIIVGLGAGIALWWLP